MGTDWSAVLFSDIPPHSKKKKWYCIFKTRSRKMDKSVVHGFAYSQKHANRQYSDVRGQTVTLAP